MMSKLEVFSENPITTAELGKELEKIKKRDKELSFRGAKVEEYIQNFAAVDEAKGKELFEKLNKLSIPRLKEMHIVKLIDLMPITADEVKMVLQGYTITVNQDNLKKIAKTIEDFKKK